LRKSIRKGEYNMFKKFAVSAMAVMIVGLFLVPMVSAECDCDTDPLKCQSRVSTRVQAGKMKMLDKWLRVYLYEKDPETWDAIGRGGAWGFLDYRPQGTEFKFLFVGKKLEPGLQYKLIYYPDPWPGEGLICLGTGTADVDGKVKIVGKGDPLNPNYSGPVNTGNLPADFDYNAEYGAKIWLVLSSDVDCDGVQSDGTPQMIGWTPQEYLFENTLITFVDTDVE
jgi:hypothetical protein